MKVTVDISWNSFAGFMGYVAGVLALVWPLILFSLAALADYLLGN